MLFAGCERTSTDAERRAASSLSDAAGSETTVAAVDDIALSPSETLERVRQFRLAGKLSLIDPYLMPEHCGAVIELIQAVDALEWANQVLQAAARKHLGRAVALSIDHAQVANIIGVFSREVAMIDERVDGDHSIVTIQVAGRVPLDQVELLRRDGRWVIQTDPPIEGLADELGKITHVWGDVARRIEEGKLNAEQLQQGLAAREALITRRIKALTDETGL